MAVIGHTSRSSPSCTSAHMPKLGQRLRSMRALSLERTADWALSTEALTTAPALFVTRAIFT